MVTVAILWCVVGFGSGAACMALYMTMSFHARVERDQSAWRLRTASQVESMAAERVELERRLLSHAEVLAENADLRRDLQNAEVMANKLALDRRQRTASADEA